MRSCELATLHVPQLTLPCIPLEHARAYSSWHMAAMVQQYIHDSSTDWRYSWKDFIAQYVHGLWMIDYYPLDRSMIYHAKFNLSLIFRKRKGISLTKSMKCILVGFTLFLCGWSVTKQFALIFIPHNDSPSLLLYFQSSSLLEAWNSNVPGVIAQRSEQQVLVLYRRLADVRISWWFKPLHKPFSHRLPTNG